MQSVRDDVTAEGLSVFQYTFPSRYVPLLGEFVDYARPSFSAQRPVLEGAIELTRRIHRDFRYDPRATTISTSLAEVFAGRAGVCQDFAHLQIACLRALGLPARYVSGPSCAAVSSSYGASRRVCVGIPAGQPAPRSE